MPATACVCRHSYTAHVVGSSQGCSFCSCQEFTDPESLAAEKQRVPEEPLTGPAVKALELMSGNALFKGVSPEHLSDFVRHGRRRLFLANATVMVQGSDSTTMQVIIKGRVRVDREMNGAHVKLAELGPGDVIGEMGVLNGDPRSATVTALDDLETLELEAPFLKQIFKEEPDILLAVMKVINQRLRTTENLVENSVKVALTELGG
jgi:CRP-like cAMP-binding protein